MFLLASLHVEKRKLSQTSYTGHTMCSYALQKAFLEARPSMEKRIDSMSAHMVGTSQKALSLCMDCGMGREKLYPMRSFCDTIYQFLLFRTARNSAIIAPHCWLLSTYAEPPSDLLVGDCGDSKKYETLIRFLLHGLEHHVLHLAGITFHYFFPKVDGPIVFLWRWKSVPLCCASGRR
jgi:hypothetical protein